MYSTTSLPHARYFSCALKPAYMIADQLELTCSPLQTHASVSNYNKLGANKVLCNWQH